MIRRLKTNPHPKGILIPTENYSNTIYDNKYVNIIGGSVSLDVDGRPPVVAPYRKVLKNMCAICGGSADYKAIWEDQYPKLQWFCNLHAQQYGPAPQYKLKVVH